MNALPIPRISVSEYVELELISEVRHEYYHGELFAMAGTTLNHNTIVGNIRRLLEDQSSCSVYTEDIMLQVLADQIYTYPDVILTCEPTRGDQRCLFTPILLVEVLSDSTSDYDRGGKFIRYQHIESLQYYVLVAQDTPLVEVYERQSNSRWLYSIYQNPTAIADLPKLGIRLALERVYQRVG